MGIGTTAVVAKIFKKYVYQQLKSFMSINGILVENQSGFPCQHSKERNKEYCPRVSCRVPRTLEISRTGSERTVKKQENDFVL
jgi:hypothetical protein